MPVALALATLGWSLLSWGAALDFGEGPTELNASTWLFATDGTLALDEPSLTHENGDFRVAATRARVAIDESRGARRWDLDLTGKVHTEFRGATLDAESANVVIFDDALVSARVTGTPAAQASFSHQYGPSGQRIDGSADAIEYQAETGEVRLSGNVRATHRGCQIGSGLAIYDLDDGSLFMPEQGSGRCPRELRQRVPPPRPPAAGSAQ